MFAERELQMQMDCINGVSMCFLRAAGWICLDWKEIPGEPANPMHHSWSGRCLNGHAPCQGEGEGYGKAVAWCGYFGWNEGAAWHRCVRASNLVQTSRSRHDPLILWISQDVPKDAALRRAGWTKNIQEPQPYGRPGPTDSERSMLPWLSCCTPQRWGGAARPLDNVDCPFGSCLQLFIYGPDYSACYLLLHPWGVFAI